MTAAGLYDVPIYILTPFLFGLILLFNWIGYKVNTSQVKKNPDMTQGGAGLTEASILGVLSILLGFTFSVALSKFETRRDLIVAEANDIGTAILRCDLYPDSIRNLFLSDFKAYVNARMKYYDVGYHEENIQQSLKEAAVISSRIWNRAALISQEGTFIVRSNQMIPVLNDMIDIVTTREATRVNGVPKLILWTLLLLVFTSASLLGADYAYRKKSSLLLLAFAIVMTLTLNLIVELDRSRHGLITNDKVEQKIEELHDMLPH